MVLKDKSLTEKDLYFVSSSDTTVNMRNNEHQLRNNT